MSKNATSGTCHYTMWGSRGWGGKWGVGSRFTAQKVDRPAAGAAWGRRARRGCRIPVCSRWTASDGPSWASGSKGQHPRTPGSVGDEDDVLYWSVSLSLYLPLSLSLSLSCHMVKMCTCRKKGNNTEGSITPPLPAACIQVSRKKKLTKKKKTRKKHLNLWKENPESCGVKNKNERMSIFFL